MPRFKPPSLPQVAGRALLVGFASGLRTMVPVGVFAVEHNNATVRGGWKSWPVMSSPSGRAVLQAATVGEMISDKLPFVPPRTDPKVWGGRMVIGALSGAAIGTLRPGPGAKIAGALCGASAAFVAAMGGYSYRTKATSLTGLPDLPFALIEDAAAIAIARKGVRG